MKTPFLIALLCLPAFAGALFAQSPSPGAQPFGLKGDVLGETLQEFRARHDRTVQTPKDKIFRTPAMTLHFPQCTDEPEVMRDWRTPESLKRRWTPEETRAGVVKCITTRDSETIAGALTFEIIYRFFNGRLYSIEAEVNRGDYPAVRDALTAKYGPGSAHGNACETTIWSNPVGSMSLGECDGLGPDPLNPTRRNTLLMIIDTVLNAEVKAADAKGREKDL